jgi:hypothetical protein
VCASAAVKIYEDYLQRVSFRRIIFFSLALQIAVGMIDVVIALRWNVTSSFRVSDFTLLMVSDDTLQQPLIALQGLPLKVLISTAFCPAPIGGTQFALLSSMAHIGMGVSSWLGAELLDSLHVSRDNVDSLWLAVLLKQLAKFLPMALIPFLLPTTSPSTTRLNPDLEKVARLVEAEGEGGQELE